MKNKEFIQGFILGKGIGFALGRLMGIVEMHITRSMALVFLTGIIIGYAFRMLSFR